MKSMCGSPARFRCGLARCSSCERARPLWALLVFLILQLR